MSKIGVAKTDAKNGEPVEVEFQKVPEPTCPYCNGTGINPDKFTDARCPCTYTPADLEPERQVSRDYSTIEPAEMPLIRNPYLDAVMNTARTTFKQTQFAKIIQTMIEAQRDADMAWYNQDMVAIVVLLKKCERAIICNHETLAGCETCCNTLAEIDAVLKGGEKWLPTHDSAVAAQAVKEVIRLCDQLIELAEHGDYSNGNVAQGTDEGTFMAMRRLTELKEELAHIRAMAGKE